VVNRLLVVLYIVALGLLSVPVLAQKQETFPTLTQARISLYKEEAKYVFEACQARANTQEAKDLIDEASKALVVAVPANGTDIFIPTKTVARPLILVSRIEDGDADDFWEHVDIPDSMLGRTVLEGRVYLNMGDLTPEGIFLVASHEFFHWKYGHPDKLAKLDFGTPGSNARRILRLRQSESEVDTYAFTFRQMLATAKDPDGLNACVQEQVNRAVEGSYRITMRPINGDSPWQMPMAHPSIADQVKAMQCIENTDKPDEFELLGSFYWLLVSFRIADQTAPNPEDARVAKATLIMSYTKNIEGLDINR